MRRVIRSGRVLFLAAFMTACWGGASPTAATEAEVGEALQRSEASTAAQSVGTVHCDNFQSGEKRALWGDLHVHTALSLDAYAFGTIAGPEDAFAFAKGGSIELMGHSAQLERPLDFTAITDHAEWLDLMYICTDPEHADDLYCQSLTQQKSSPRIGAQLFRDYVVPTLTGPEPKKTPICEDDPERCAVAAGNQWERVQKAANAANDPCNFTAFIGFEWSATPSFRHTHRNLVFASDQVTAQAIDYLRYPDVSQLWEQLERQCRPEEGCDVVAIPHNMNMGDGISFDVETESEANLLLRAKYERLAEVHQEKGASECLPAFGVSDEVDCNFELYLTSHSQAKVRDDFEKEEWEKTRSTYVRSLLLRGLAAYQARPDLGNPLQLGIIGSTDNHEATPGFVDEAAWGGPGFALGNLDAMMTRVDFNPGGIVAVWAEENTREAVFAALKRREVYGTSGPRIELRFAAAAQGETLSCDMPGLPDSVVTMGGQFEEATATPHFIVQAKADREDLDKIEIIKGAYADGEVEEVVQPIWTRSESGREACAVWRDPSFDADVPAFWYARVKEAPTKRWSQVKCEAAGRCDDFPQAVGNIQERAWASPIWYLPSGG